MRCEAIISGFGDDGEELYCDAADFHTTPVTYGKGNRYWVLDRVEHLLKNPDVTKIQISIVEA